MAEFLEKSSLYEEPFQLRRSILNCSHSIQRVKRLNLKFSGENHYLCCVQKFFETQIY